MMLQKIDYLALRQYYEAKNDQRMLDEVISRYLDSDCSMLAVIKDVTISEQMISQMSLYKLTLLVINGAKPKDKMIERILEYSFPSSNKNYICLKALYDGGHIDSESFEKLILKDKDKMSMISKLLFGEKVDEYLEQMDSSLIEQELLDSLKNTSDPKTCGDIFAAATALLIKTPHSDLHDELVTTMIKLMKEEPGLRENIKYFIDRLIFKGKDVETIINFLRDRVDLLSLIFSARIDLPVWYSSEITAAIADGRVTDIAFAFYLDTTLTIDKTNIINAWVHNDMQTALDVYLLFLLDDKLPSRGESNSLDKEVLDQVYKIDKQYKDALKEREISEEKKI